MMFIYDNAQSVREVCAGTYKTEAALQAAVVAAMAVAIAAAESFTCTVTVSTYTQQDIQNVVRRLISNGFGVRSTGTTIVITW